MKVFQDRESLSLVVDESDLHAVTDGRNFISLLRSRYESVRLDLEAEVASSSRSPCVAGVHFPG